MGTLNRKVFADLVHRKLRTALTVLGITIGIMGLSSINIASHQLQQSFLFSTDVAAQPDIQVLTAPTTASMGNELAHLANVALVQSNGLVFTRWSIPSGHLGMMVQGIVDFHHVQIAPFDLVEGQLPGPQHIVLESSDRAITAVHVGDQVQLQIQGSIHTLTVSGFVRTRGRLSTAITQQALGYMNEQDLETLFHQSGVNDFLLRLRHYEQRDATGKDVVADLQAHHILINTITVGHNTANETLTTSLLNTMRILSLLALSLSIFLLLGTIMNLVAEQTRIIGTMKAIGSGSGRVILHYSKLVAIYGILGTLLGLGLGIVGGYGLAHYLGDLFNLDIGSLEVPVETILECVFLGIAGPVLAALIPLFVGTRMTVRQALSGTGTAGSTSRQGSGKGSAVGNWLFGWLPRTLQMGISSLFRKRSRTLITLLTLTLCGAAFIAVQTANTSLDSFITHFLGNYQYNAMVVTSFPVPTADMQHRIAAVHDVGLVEPVAMTTVQTQWGDALLTGLLPHTHLYQPQLLVGRWLTDQDHDVVVLSQDAADASGLQVGGTLTFHTSFQQATWHIVGIVKDSSGANPGDLGALFAPLSAVNTFSQLPTTVANRFMVQSGSQAGVSENTLAQNLDGTLGVSGLQVTVQTMKQQLQRGQNELQIFYALLSLVTLIVALVGIMGLFNALAMSVLERRREIGILRSMGATSRNVAQVFWAEGIMMGFISWGIAVLIGIPAAYGFVVLLNRILLPFPFVFNSVSLVWMLIFSMSIASVASIGPVLAASHIKIAQTLRYE